MTYQEIKEIVAQIADELGCDYNYYEDEEKDVVKTPYLLFDYPSRDDMFADDQNYVPIQRLNIEYDSKQKDIDAEKKIESILDSYDLTYTKEDQRYEDQNVYEVMYSMEVMING